MSFDRRSPVNPETVRTAASAAEAVSRLRERAEGWQEQPFPPDLAELQRVVVATAAISEAAAGIARALEIQFQADAVAVTPAGRELVDGVRAELASARTDQEQVTEHLSRVVLMNVERRLGLDMLG